jgi:hypothetical protein
MRHTHSLCLENKNPFVFLACSATGKKKKNKKCTHNIIRYSSAEAKEDSFSHKISLHCKIVLLAYHSFILSSLHPTMMCKNTTSQNLKIQCGSPVSVMDLSAVFEQLDQIEGLKLVQAPAMTGGLSFPVLDSITASLTEEADSISSLSTDAHQDGSAEANEGRCVPNKRSIFSKYWEMTGEKALKPQNRMASLRRQRAIADGMDKSRAHYSSQPSEQEGTSCDMLDYSMRTTCSQEQEQQERPRRRSIFGHKALPPSLRSLPTMANEDEELKPVFRTKALSASALQELPSCLRCHAPRRRSSSVSFDEKIDVLVFQKPQEQFSEDGWEQLFHA